MARKPRNVRTERLTDWRFFFQIYLVRFFNVYVLKKEIMFIRSSETVHGFDDVALRNGDVVPLHG